MMFYRILTWDAEAEMYTPPEEIDAPSANLTLWQLRAALRALRGEGYTCHYLRRPGGHHDNDPAVLVESSETPWP